MSTPTFFSNGMTYQSGHSFTVAGWPYGGLVGGNTTGGGYGQWNAHDQEFFQKSILRHLQGAITVTNETTLVIDAQGLQKAFEGKNSEKEALEFADERADATRGTVYILRPFKKVTPERKTKVTDL